MEHRELTDEELGFIESFIEHSSNVIGTTLTVPIRVSYSIGDLTMHLYIETTKKKK